MAIASIVWLAAAAWVLAQAYPNQPYQIQQGNVLDRNPQLGSGGFNVGARTYPINGGNRIVTGNVTNGAAFRGFSPISDPSSFGLSNSSALPSDTLYGFRRDANNVGNITSGRYTPFTTSPYYSTSSAIVNTGGIVSGLNRPGTSQVQSPYLPPRMDMRVMPSNPLDAGNGTSLLGVSPRIERVDSGQAVSGPVNNRLLASPLFGAIRAIPADQLSAEAAADRGLGASMTTSIDSRLEPQAPTDQRIRPEGAGAGTTGLLDSPMARIMANDQRVGATGRPTNGTPVSGQRLDVATPDARLPDTVLPAAKFTSPSEAADTFVGMRQMHGDVMQPLRTTPTLADAARAERAERSQGKIERPLTPPAEARREAPAANAVENAMAGRAVQGGPLRTFVGTEKSAINRYLKQAEAFIRHGEYYKAADMYENARLLDSKNPLPLLGRALSLLAAGEYVSSANSLFSAIQTYEGLVDFPVDLPSFIPDINVLDRRRADMEQRLERGDDYRLRFLLGYAEYCSGMQKLGLQDMTRAAAAAPQEMESLRHFVSVLALHPLSPTSRPAR